MKTLLLTLALAQTPDVWVLWEKLTILGPGTRHEETWELVDTVDETFPGARTAKDACVLKQILRWRETKNLLKDPKLLADGWRDRNPEIPQKFSEELTRFVFVDVIGPRDRSSWQWSYLCLPQRIDPRPR